MRSWKKAAAAAVIAGVSAAGPGTAALAAGQAPAVPSTSGTYRSAVYIKNAVSHRAGDASAVAVADVTGDGRPDLVAVTARLLFTADTAVAVYPQLRNGRLGAPLVLKTPDQTGLFTPVTIADLYGNGRREILLPTTSGVDVFSVSKNRLRMSRIPMPLANDVTLANFNGDKYPDLLIAAGQPHVTQVWTGSASHKFRLWRTVVFPHSFQFSTGSSDTVVAAADFDRNGLTDIVMETFSGFAVRMQTSHGNFGAEKDYKLAPVNGVSFRPGGMSVGDVTSDGYPDVIISANTNRPFSGIVVYPGARNGPFRTPGVYPTLDLPAAIGIADLTGNGRKDVIVGHDGEGSVGIMMQRADGTLGAEVLYPVTLGALSQGLPAIGDLNRDGKPDIAFSAGERGIGILYQR